jgi:hypothetical protein
MKWIQFAFLLIGFTLVSARAQEPDIVVLKAPKPPAVLLKDNVARIRVDMAPDSARHPFAVRLKSAIEQALQSDFVLSESKPDAIITVGISAFENPVGRETVEVRKCKDLRSLGGRPDRCVTDQGGGAISILTRGVQDYMQRVQYWQASGSLSLRVKLVDQKNSIEDNFNPTFRNNTKFIVAVDGRPLGRKTQTNSELLEAMLDGAAHTIKGQYAFGFDERSVPLTTQKDLDLGNGYAVAGDWKAAMDSWERAKGGPDRSYSLGVAEEALAYANYASTRKFDEPRKMLQKSQQSYKEAMDGAGRDRARQQRTQLALVAVPKSIGYMDELEKLQQIRELAAQAAADAGPVGGGAGGKGLDDPLSTPEAKKFRELIERQITAIPGGKPSDEQQQRWRKLGETGFKMTPDGSRQVVEQVIAGRTEMVGRMGQYRDSMVLYLSDKNISKKEREDLKTLQEALQLSPEAVAEVESSLRPFSEEGVDAQAGRPNPRARPPYK